MLHLYQVQRKKDQHPAQGGPPHPLAERLITELRPRLVIEVGCWKGASAVATAKALRARGLETPLICVDTWLGSAEHLTGLFEPKYTIDYAAKAGS